MFLGRHFPGLCLLNKKVLWIQTLWQKLVLGFEGQVAVNTGCRIVRSSVATWRWNSTAPLAEARQILEHELQSIRDAGTYKRERVITSKQAVSVQVQGQTQWLLNFCANNYLGLSVIKRPISASKISSAFDYFAHCRAIRM